LLEKPHWGNSLVPCATKQQQAILMSKPGALPL
jgi:hypothetical protein